MANRKQENLKIERDLKSRKLVARVIALVVALALLGAIGFGIWAAQDARWLMRYDGGRVAVADFTVVHQLHFQNEPGAHQAALHSLQAVVALIDRAETHGVGLTAEERIEAEAAAQSQREWQIMMHGPGATFPISNARMAELFTVEAVSARLMDIYVPTYELVEEDFAEMWENYKENNLHDHYDIEVMLLVLEDADAMQEAYSLVGTTDFADIVRQFNEWIEEDDDVDVIPLTGQDGLLGMIEQMMLSPEDREMLLELQPGEVSPIIPLFEWDQATGNIESFEVLVYVVSRDDEIDLDEIEADLRARVIESRRFEMFNDLVINEWVDEANFVINQRGFDRI